MQYSEVLCRDVGTQKGQTSPHTQPVRHLHVEIQLPLDTSTNVSKMHSKLTTSAVKFYLVPTRFSFPSVSASPQMATWSFQLLRTEKWSYCLLLPFSHDSKPDLSVVLLAPAVEFVQTKSPSYHFCHCQPWAMLISRDWWHSPLKNLRALTPALLLSVLNAAGRVNLLEAEVWSHRSFLQNPPLAAHFHQISTSDFEMIS